MSEYVINVDLARVTFPSLDKPGETDLRVLGWGDTVEIADPAQDITDAGVRITRTVFKSAPDGSVENHKITGTIKAGKGIKGRDIVVEKAKSKVLKIDFVDVQQGDGSVIETPEGKIILIDGGDNQLFARYLANRFRDSSDENPRFIDCVLITHGDADHFSGLSEIRDSESLHARKSLFLCPERVYHSGLVKRPGMNADGTDRKDEQMLGKTELLHDPGTGEDVLVITGLEEDLRTVADSEMNGPFKTWKDDVIAYADRLKKRKGADKDINYRRLEKGSTGAFDFITNDGKPGSRDKDIKVDVLAPILTELEGKRGLKFLHTPPKGPRTSKEFLSVEDEEFGKSFSASHTINGHSIVFRLRYGGFTFLFSGDLNDEAERILTKAHNRNELNLQSEVFKVPHHGSHDFSGAFIQAVAPVISVISSGDESARKEFVHPRATIVGALGKSSRVDEPIIFITELVAFFQIEGWFRKEYHELTEAGKEAKRKGVKVVDPGDHDFFAFSRAAFGLVMVRTDGERLLVYTNSALEKMKEAYVFEMDEFGKPQPAELRQV
jgi:beta-lactamase superfamily II metal-dependent hydrolase